MLEEKIKYVHVFVIAIDTEDSTKNAIEDLKPMLNVFGSRFGYQFWKNVVIVGTKWKFSAEWVGIQKIIGYTEKNWIAEQKQEFSNNFPEIPVNIYTLLSLIKHFFEELFID